MRPTERMDAAAAARGTVAAVGRVVDGTTRSGSWASRLRSIIDESGPDAVAFYISGQLLTEDYYVVNKLAKGFIGTNNVDSNSRLCMSSAVAGYTGAFGSDGPPAAYADLDLADCLLLLGSNTAACHPILGSHPRAAGSGARVIVADPRRRRPRSRPTCTCRCGRGPTCRCSTPCSTYRPRPARRPGLRRGADEAGSRRRWRSRASGRRSGPRRCAACPRRDIERAAEWFGAAGAAMTLWSMGANQSTVGTLKNRALINLCLATGQPRAGRAPARSR